MKLSVQKLINYNNLGISKLLKQDQIMMKDNDVKDIEKRIMQAHGKDVIKILRMNTKFLRMT